VYERHDLASQALHRVVRENLATFYAAIEQGWENGLPEFVRAEFSRTAAEPAHSKPLKPRPSGNRCRYIRWATLLRLTFGLTVDQCPACGGQMKLRALVRDSESIERFLRHENLWSPPPTPSPARAPPYDRSVTRLQPTRQQDLFPAEA
jgi:hypothetical protein